ncbi:hypothetical protein SAMN05216552_1010197 [Pseudoduganella namucuonensis]|uniref:Uncharacterized protein n=1 Tax=Pseudoduganella namucuonensis TaxID=1035707 RepID=A0A1I7JA71_9BURK|nr:hypothetical protein SAMN05216552_1010197 [Pseudoduganella namucuonensis]
MEIIAFNGKGGELLIRYLEAQVWAHVKRQVSKQFVQDKEGMKKLALGALRRIQKLPAMVKSFFKQQECRYAA